LTMAKSLTGTKSALDTPTFIPQERRISFTLRRWREEAFERIKKYTEQVVESLKPHAVILFGSFARGDINEGSDVDIVGTCAPEAEPLLTQFSANDSGMNPSLTRYSTGDR